MGGAPAPLSSSTTSPSFSLGHRHHRDDADDFTNYSSSREEIEAEEEEAVAARLIPLDDFSLFKAWKLSRTREERSRKDGQPTEQKLSCLAPLKKSCGKAHRRSSLSNMGMIKLGTLLVEDENLLKKLVLTKPGKSLSSKASRRVTFSLTEGGATSKSNTKDSSFSFDAVAAELGRISREQARGQGQNLDSNDQ